MVQALTHAKYPGSAISFLDHVCEILDSEEYDGVDLELPILADDALDFTQVRTVRYLIDNPNHNRTISSFMLWLNMLFSSEIASLGKRD